MSSVDDWFKEKLLSLAKVATVVPEAKVGWRSFFKAAILDEQYGARLARVSRETPDPDPLNQRVMFVRHADGTRETRVVSTPEEALAAARADIRGRIQGDDYTRHMLEHSLQLGRGPQEERRLTPLRLAHRPRQRTDTDPLMPPERQHVANMLDDVARWRPGK